MLGAATSLAQAYGVTSDLFSLNRAPGGTFGNRNFMAHLAAIGTPALIFATITARRAWTAVLGTRGLAIIAAALVLSRSRAAWLGLGRRRGAARARTLARAPPLERTQGCAADAAAGARAAVGVLASLLMPNTLEWKSDSPYLDTVTGVVNYREGSGRGRIVQYANTLRIVAAHPFLGVGPGNWGVVYPKFAAPNDPSIDLDDGMTSNPWPSSDWIAIARRARRAGARGDRARALRAC